MGFRHVAPIGKTLKRIRRLTLIRVDDDQDGASVYVRGGAVRRGIGAALLRLAEEHARAHGAKTIQIQASLAGIEFYKANGFQELGYGEALLMSGLSMPCVFMRKTLTGF